MQVEFILSAFEGGMTKLQIEELQIQKEKRRRNDKIRKDRGWRIEDEGMKDRNIQNNIPRITVCSLLWPLYQLKSLKIVYMCFLLY